MSESLTFYGEVASFTARVTQDTIPNIDDAILKRRVHFKQIRHDEAQKRQQEIEEQRKLREDIEKRRQEERKKKEMEEEAELRKQKEREEELKKRQEEAPKISEDQMKIINGAMNTIVDIVIKKEDTQYFKTFVNARIFSKTDTAIEVDENQVKISGHLKTEKEPLSNSLFDIGTVLADVAKPNIINADVFKDMFYTFFISNVNTFTSDVRADILSLFLFFIRLILAREKRIPVIFEVKDMSEERKSLEDLQKLEKAFNSIEWAEGFKVAAGHVYGLFTVAGNYY